MVIREQQMQALSASVTQSFRLQLVEELRDFAPWHAKVLAQAGLAECVDFAMQRAETYGFTNRGPIRLYLQMIFLLGAEFDTDPLLAWASHVLSDGSIQNQTDRATYLYEALLEYLKHVAGPNNTLAKSALVRAREEVVRSSSSRETGEDPKRIILEGLRRVYPEKCAYAGDAAVQKTIDAGLLAAAKYSAATVRGGLLFCGLIFGLGHGFENDPHLPWIRKTLQDPALTEIRLVERLSSRVNTYLDHVLAHVV